MIILENKLIFRWSISFVLFELWTTFKRNIQPGSFFIGFLINY